MNTCDVHKRHQQTTEQEIVAERRLSKRLVGAAGNLNALQRQVSNIPCILYFLSVHYSKTVTSYITQLDSNFGRSVYKVIEHCKHSQLHTTDTNFGHSVLKVIKLNIVFR